MSEDRRGAFRRNAFTFGAVEFGGGEVGCLVWDVTANGALLEFEEPLALPSRIRVRLSPDAAWCEASVAWCKGNRAGVALG